MNELYTITEIQVLSNGAIASQTFDRTSWNDALNVYYSSLAAGAINGIPYHATYLIDSKRGVRMSNIFDRRVTENG
jgi:hypothetical protein